MSEDLDFQHVLLQKCLDTLNALMFTEKSALRFEICKMLLDANRDTLPFSLLGRLSFIASFGDAVLFSSSKIPHCFANSPNNLCVNIKL
jgi:hypothetical protein